MEFRDADDELRPPDLVAERRAVAEEVRRVAGEAERHAQKPGAEHGDRPARVDPLGVDQPHVPRPWSVAAQWQATARCQRPTAADSERFPFAGKRVPERAEEAPAEAEGGGKKSRGGGGFRQRVYHPGAAVDAAMSSEEK